MVGVATSTTLSDAAICPIAEEASATKLIVGLISLGTTVELDGSTTPTAMVVLMTTSDEDVTTTMNSDEVAGMILLDELVIEGRGKISGKVKNEGKGLKYMENS